MTKAEHIFIINTLLFAEDIPAEHKITLLNLKDSLINDEDSVNNDTLEKSTYIIANILAIIARFIE